MTLNFGESVMIDSDSGVITHRLQNLLKELKVKLQKLYGDRLFTLLLYGSVARGEANADSDIDILVVLRDRVLPMSEIRRMADIKLDFLLEFGELLSIMPMSLDEFNDNSASFINSIRRDGIAL
jgi:predicted nucleotidyltransferase